MKRLSCCVAYLRVSVSAPRGWLRATALAATALVGLACEGSAPDIGDGGGGGGDEDGPTANTAPTAAVVSLAPAAPVTTDDLSVSLAVASTDVDGDAITYVYRWLKDGAELADLNASTVAADRTQKGETWQVVVIADDGRAQSPPAQAEVTIGNVPPGASVVFTPTAPTRATPLQAVTTLQDIDGDEVTATYAWTIDGAPLSVVGDTLPASALVHGRTISVRVTPNDGEDDGEVVVASVLVGNSAPTIAAVTLSPTDAVTTDVALTATVDGVTDLDDDHVTLLWRWFVDDVERFDVSGPTLPPYTARKGQSVVVEVTPADGLASGEPLASALVVIVDAFPALASAALEPPALREASVVSCVLAGFVDIDGDDDASSVRWFVNDALVTSGPVTTTLSGSAFARGDRVRCEGEPRSGDMLASGGIVTSSEAIVQNTPPVIGSVTVTPSQATAGVALRADVDGVFDDDGDAVTTTFRWRVGPTVVGTGSTLLPPSLRRGDVVTLEAVPFDDSDGGPAVTSEPITITNAAPSTPTIAVTPAQPGDADELRCSVSTGSVDIDGDPLRYAIAWTENGASTAFATGNAPVGTAVVVPASATAIGETWACTVVAEDGAGGRSSATQARSIPEPACTATSFAGGAFGEVADSPSLTLGSDDFTIEFFVRRVGVAPVALLLGHDEGEGNVNKWLVGIGPRPTGNSIFLHLNSPATGPLFFLDAPMQLPLDRWSHVAIVRRGEELGLFVDGRRSGRDAITVAVPDPAAPLTLAQVEGRGFVDGAFSDVRISRVARYRGDFQPVRPLRADEQTIALWRLDADTGPVANDDGPGGLGMVLRNGAVVRTAPSMCLRKACSEALLLESGDRCVSACDSGRHDGGDVACVSTERCSAGFLLEADRSCARTCATGRHDGGDGRCVEQGTCSTRHLLEDDGQCVDVCDPGRHDGGDGRCVARLVCSLGFSLEDDGSCRSSCTSGRHDGGDGVCVPLGQCADSFHDGGDGVCVVAGSCRDGFHDGGDGICLGEVAITSGGDHVCVKNADGGIRCFGSDDVDQLAAPAGRFFAVAAGERWTCALDAQGLLHCWGAQPVLTLANPGPVCTDFLTGSSVLDFSVSVPSIDAAEVTLDLRRSGKFAELQTAELRAPAASCIASLADSCQSCVFGCCARTLTSASLTSTSCPPGGRWGIRVASPDSRYGVLTACVDVFRITAVERPPSGPQAAVALGPTMGCAIGAAGAACWGELGDAGAPLVPVEAISVGGDFACGLDSVGQAWCRGATSWFTDDTPLPAPDPSALPLRALDAGLRDVCGLTLDDVLVCWGESAVSSAAPTGLFSAVSVGADAACALRLDGRAECWGDGIGADPLPGPWGSLSVGTGFSCGVRPGGAVECWGALTAPVGGATRCAVGFYDSGGACVRSCAEGALVENGNRCEDECYPGRHDGGTSACVPVGGCSPGFVREVNDTCVDTCASDRHDGGDGDCVAADACSPGFVLDGDRVCREACSAGLHDGGDAVCVPTGRCSAGYLLEADGRCQDTCNAGRHDDGDGSCVALDSCRSGFLLDVDGRCVTTCTAGAHDGGDGTCVAVGSCSGGFQDGGAGTCETVGTCSDGFLLESDGSCRGACLAARHDGGDGVCVADGACSFGFHLVADGSCVLTVVQQVTAGDGYSCAVLSSGAVSCFGDNRSGQSSAPAGTWIQADAGTTTTCAIDAGGNLTCWGAELLRELRAAPRTCQTFLNGTSIVDVTIGVTLPKRTTTVIDLQRSGKFAEFQQLDIIPPRASCALTVTNGSVGCAFGTCPKWLTSLSRSLPNCDPRGNWRVTIRNPNSRYGVLDACLDLFTIRTEDPSPTGSFRAVTVGRDLGCAMTSNRDARCWGSLTTVAPPAGPYESLVAGDAHVCGLAVGGQVRCWGSDDRGQLRAPASVFTAVGCGAGHCCAIAADSTLMCWGDNTKAQATAPTGRFVSVSAGATHTCALDAEGAVRCFGEDVDGRLSPPPDRFRSIVAGTTHTCGVTTLGGVRCWGTNDRGQTTVTLPVR